MRRLLWIVLIVVLLILAPASALAHDAIRVEYTTSDGVQIVGDYWTPIQPDVRAPVVILLHMFGSDRTAWTDPMIIALEKAGFAVMRIDLRGHGESVQPASQNLADRVRDADHTLFQAMYHDVEGAVEWLKGRSEVNLDKLGFLAASVGCSVTLNYATRHPIQVAVLLSPGADYLGINSLEDINRYGKKPLMVLTSRQESGGGFARLLSAARSSGVDIEPWIYPQKGIHGTRMLGKVEGLEERIAEFLKKHLLGE